MATTPEQDKNKKEIHQPDDRFFRSVMLDAKNARAYLISFYPEIAAQLDLQTLQLDNTSYIDDQLKTFHSDIVYRCQFKGSKEGLYFSLLWEHKSSPDNGVVLQIGLYALTAMYRMYKEKDRKLEPVLPLVFYNGKTDWIPKTITELFKDHPFLDQFEQYLPKFEFNFLNISKVPTEELLNIKFRFLRSAIFSMANRHNADILIEKIVFLFQDQTADEVKSLAHYIFGIIERSPKEIQTAFKKLDFTTKGLTMSVLEQVRTEALKEGKIEGKMEGKIEERTKSLLDKLKGLFSIIRKFPSLTDDDLAEFTAMEATHIKEIRVGIAKNDRAQLKEDIIALLFEDLPLTVEDEQLLEEIIA